MTSPPAARNGWRTSPVPPAPDAPLTARILIVDDDERNAFAAAQALADLGHELVVARSGAEALRRLLEEDFTVILLDLHMPDMDGYETAALIRARRRSALTPIVFLTAIFRDEAHVFQAYSAGAVDVVFKPVDPFILRSKVKVLTELHLKTHELERQAAYQGWLLAERDRAQAARAAAERRLRLAEEREAAILRSLPIIFHARQAEPPYTPTFVGGAVREITGYEGADFLARPDLGSSSIHPDDRDAVVEAVGGAARGGGYACEFRFRCADGRYRTLHDQGVMGPAVDGRPREIFGAIVDVTERRSLEEQLAQARRMEALGQLTGGVAHDFNNLLMVILGNAEMLSGLAEDEAKRGLRLEAICQAADRGRALVRQLLAFARRQQLNPSVRDVNALITEFAPLLRQAVGEAVKVDYQPGEGELCSVVDCAQLETALLNLGVNARDAMAEGGSLAIRTRKVGEDGRQWIEIEVADTGPGMAAEIRDRAFEPFFTTKEVGVGSGLGLSQVYGFVSQSGGDVRLESAPGKGTTFRLRLPASAQRASAARDAASAAQPLGGSEVIVVVDDDPSVLALTVDMLKAHGYGVLTAADAAQALATLKAHPEAQVLFTDVTMPGGLSGVGLAHEARRLFPDLRVLLTSGYVGEKGVGGAFPLLDKPFESEALAAALRRAIDTPPRRVRRRATATRTPGESERRQAH